MITIDKVKEFNGDERDFGTNEKDNLREWMDLASVHEYIKANPKPWEDKTMSAHANGLNSSVKDGRSSYWDLNLGWEGAVEMGYTGWEEGAEKLRVALDAIDDFAPVSSIEDEADGMEFVRAEEGEVFIPEAYFSGEEEFMFDVRFKTHKPVVRICCNLSASGSVSADVLQARGTVMAAVSRKLERLGYGVQVWASVNSDNSGGAAIDLIRVKDSAEYIDDRALAFWLSHPGAFRRLGFRMLETQPARCEVGGAYGRPLDFKSDDFDMISASGHLHRAQKEGWHGKPEKAAIAAQELLTEILSGEREAAYEA